MIITQGVVDSSKEIDRPDGLVEVENKEEPGAKLIVPRDEAEVAHQQQSGR